MKQATTGPFSSTIYSVILKTLFFPLPHTCTHRHPSMAGFSVDNVGFDKGIVIKKNI